MTDLNEIIQSFTEDENLQFVQFLQKRNKRNETKNIQLFQLLHQKGLSTKEVSIQLYKKENKAALYALRKRLYQSIIDFTAKKALEDENSIDMQVAKYLLAARRFFEKGQASSAFKIIDKAEQLAKENHLYALLNEVYYTKIQYAHLSPSTAIDKQIADFRHNQKLNATEEELNIAYATIRQAVNKAEHQGEIIDFESLVTRVFDAHKLDLNQILTYQSLYQMATIISVSAFSKKDYYRIEPFLLSAYHQLKSKPSKSKQLLYHIHVVYLLANTLFRNKKFDLAQEYLQIMHELMQANYQKYDKLFQLKYNLLLGLVQHYSGEQNKAIQLFEDILIHSFSDTASYLDIQLSLAMCYFQKGELSKAKQLFSKFKHTDYWYIQKNGQEWVMKKNLIEILLYLELGELNLFESRLLSFKRNYFGYLKKINQERVITYLSLVESCYKNPSQVATEAFSSKVEHSFSWYAYEDIFVMSFYAWLKSKMERRNIYEVTLELVAKKS